MLTRTGAHQTQGPMQPFTWKGCRGALPWHWVDVRAGVCVCFQKKRKGTSSVFFLKMNSHRGHILLTDKTVDNVLLRYDYINIRAATLD